MDLGIQGRTAIVTGGARGIGREIASRLLEAGVRVTICARTKATLEQARDELAAKSGGEVLAVVADMAVAADVERLAREARDRFGPADILVNNAGQMYSGRFEAMTEDGLRAQLETKLFGFMRAIRLVIDEMRARRWGRIVNVIGGAGKEPDPYMLGSGSPTARCSTSPRRCPPSSGPTTSSSTPCVRAGSTRACGNATFPASSPSSAPAPRPRRGSWPRGRTRWAAGDGLKSWRTPSRFSARSAPASSRASR